MPVTCTFSDRLIRCTYLGKVGATELAQALVYADDIEREFGLTPDRLTDLTQIEDAQLSFAELAPLARRRRMQVFKNPYRSAVVAAKPFQFGLARMFQSMVTTESMELQIFNDEASALAWLRSPKKHQTPE
jgi:hypothetical protein